MLFRFVVYTLGFRALRGRINSQVDKLKDEAYTGIKLFYTDESYLKYTQLIFGYYPKAEFVETSLNKVSFKDLLTRRLYFCAIPSKSVAVGFKAKLKRKLIKLLCLSAADNLKIREHVDTVLSKSSQKRELFSFPPYVSEIYSYHFENFRVVNLYSITLATNKTFYNFILYVLVLILKKLRLLTVDNIEGTAAFLNVTQFWWIRAYKLIHPNKQLIVRLHDCLSFNHYDAQKLGKALRALLKEHIIFKAESYSKPDAIALGIDYRPNGVNFEKLMSLRKNYCKYLYTFVGVENQNSSKRHKVISELSTYLKSVYKNADKYINNYFLKPNTVEQSYLPYSQYLEYVSESEIVLDFVRVKADEGISFRIAEGLALGKKIITNRTNIINEPFYDEDKIFVIGKEPLENLQSFIEAGNALNGKTSQVSEHSSSLINIKSWWSQSLMEKC